VKIALAALTVVPVAGAVIYIVAFQRTPKAPAAPALPAAVATARPVPTPTPTQTAPQRARANLPRTWPRGLRTSNTRRAILVACLDHNLDGHINADDSPQYAGLDIHAPGIACVGEGVTSDYYAGPPSDPATYTCTAPKRPLLIVAIGGAGTDLLNAPEGESLGLLDIVNDLQARATATGISTLPVLTSSAITGAEPGQTSMERWLAHDVAARLDATPCLRAVIIGHSHGAVTVSSVTAALDRRYSARLYGVLIDRSTVLYDRFATDYPAKTPLLNVFQLNEGWHGEPFHFPNAIDVDASAETAPIAPSDGGGPPARVTHKTLDDSPAAQHLIEDAIMQWATATP
jgi:pimeloyl-ACP methyl ester carboxylesterase